ncbi:MAG TPA: hypothetical protein VF916_03605 [Ktedonobacterales bacterium]
MSQENLQAGSTNAPTVAPPPDLGKELPPLIAQYDRIVANRDPAPTRDIGWLELLFQEFERATNALQSCALRQLAPATGTSPGPKQALRELNINERAVLAKQLQQSAEAAKDQLDRILAALKSNKPSQAISAVTAQGDVRALSNVMISDAQKYRARLYRMQRHLFWWFGPWTWLGAK